MHTGMMKSDLEAGLSPYTYIDDRVTDYRERFNQLQDATVLSKVKDYARWTIPYIAAEVQDNGMQAPIEGDFQSAGALLVNSLSSKLTGLLFPTTYPFMALELSQEGRRALEEVLEEHGEDPSTLSNFLAVLTRDASAKCFTGRTFFQLVLAFKHLIVSGNVAVRRVPEEGSLMCYGLESFVVRRDGLGRVMEGIIKEKMYFHSLPEDVQQFLVGTGHYGNNSEDLTDRVVTQYTRILRDGPYYVETVGIDQHVLGQEFVTLHEVKKLPFIFPTWTLLHGEHYGRGLVEELKGDFAKLSELSEALTLYEIEMARVVNLVSAESFDAIDDLNAAETGEYVRATPGAVVAHESGSADKVQQLLADLEVVFNRLARAMMWRGNTREGERVTAFEIQQEIQEVEATMGGAYSSLAESFQLPLSYLLLYEVNESFMNAAVDLGVGHVGVTTGINALGKTSKAQQMIEAILQGAQTIEAAQMDQRLDPTKIMDLIFESKGLDITEISKSEEQLDQEAHAQMQAAEAQQDLEAADSMAALGDSMELN